MDAEMFTELVQDIYDNLPQWVQEKIVLHIEEKPTPYGMLFPDLLGHVMHWPFLNHADIFICYWGFERLNKYTYSLIKEVVYHEIQHFFEGPYGKLAQNENIINYSLLPA